MKKQTFKTGDYATEDEAAFAYNVAALVLEGPNAELKEGMNLTLERKREIEREVLQQVRLYLELPKETKLGPFPQLYAQKPPNTGSADTKTSSVRTSPLHKDFFNRLVIRGPRKELDAFRQSWLQGPLNADSELPTWDWLMDVDYRWEDELVLVCQAGATMSPDLVSKLAARWPELQFTQPTAPAPFASQGVPERPGYHTWLLLRGLDPTKEEIAKSPKQAYLVILHDGDTSMPITVRAYAKDRYSAIKAAIAECNVRNPRPPGFEGVFGVAACSSSDLMHLAVDLDTDRFPAHPWS
jgi:hypothetical protein